MSSAAAGSPSMFVPPYYAAADARAILQRYPFGTLITGGDAGLQATALPFVFETDAPEEMRLLGHLAGRNAQSRSLRTGQSVLMLFSGPNAYISAAHYRDKPQVPTWNYVAAQARGVLEVLPEREQRMFVLERTVEVMERDRSQRWTMADAPDGMVDKLTEYITAFRVVLTSIEGAEKLSQAHPPADRHRVIRGLLNEQDGGGIAIAKLMARVPDTI